MPTAAKQRCRGGCGALVSGTWCERCKPDRRRFSKGGTAYNSARWIRLRDGVRTEQPFCANPDKDARCTLLTDVVDHIVPHRGNERLMYDRTNLQGLCASCHARKTAAEVGWSGTRGGM